MFRKLLAIGLVTLTPLVARAYDTGELTCENIGQLAGQTLLAKQSGIPEEVYLSALNERLPDDARLERKLVQTLTTIIYHNDLLPAMEPTDASVVFQQDCLRGQAADRVKGQIEDNSGNATDQEGDQDLKIGESRT